MPRARTCLLLPLLAGGLAACAPAGTGTELDSFAGIDAYGADLQGVVIGLDFSDPATLPAAGSAEYRGVIGLDSDLVVNEPGETYDMAGELRLVAGFATDSIDGTATNFYSPREEAIGGTLEVGFGAIVRDADPATDDGFEADIEGRLEYPDGDRLDLSADLSGDFYGSGASHVAGEVVGTGCFGASCSGLDGGFVAGRD